MGYTPPPPPPRDADMGAPVPPLEPLPPTSKREIMQEAQLYDRDRLVLLEKAIEEFLAGRITQDQLEKTRQELRDHVHK